MTAGRTTNAVPSAWFLILYPQREFLQRSLKHLGFPRVELQLVAGPSEECELEVCYTLDSHIGK